MAWIPFFLSSPNAWTVFRRTKTVTVSALLGIRGTKTVTVDATRLVGFPLTTGGTLTLDARAFLSGAEVTGATVSSVASSNTSVLTVTPSSGTTPLTLTVTGVAAGTATVTANISGFTRTLGFRVS